ncbi:MAG: PIG-L family deacetylase [Flavobacterium sp.]|jgi:LmbE family N-acetylglucosaminyl deacetylase
MIKKITLILLVSIGFNCFSQAPKKLSSNEIYNQIEKLNFLGKVLYVAAHPDDENTRLISYFSNHYHAETAYLSLTRGDGGQNLIGNELREKLGAIRTQELLAARRIDGGKQFFTRANDFGYSKEPNETFTIWNKKQVLEDVIQTIETFQPDIIINRFNHRTPGTTHGHHTASAILSLEAYDALKTKPKRVFFNTSWWFYGSQENFDKADKSNLVAIDANVYFASKGLSNYEIAALSRSQHKCQGFGTTGSRGSETEYLELLKGDLPTSGNIFEGIDTSWNRIEGGKEIGIILNKIQENFNFNNPSIHIPELIKAYRLISNLKDNHWKTLKQHQVSAIIEACSGLYLEAVSNQESVTKSENFSINIEATNRSNSKSKLISVNVFNSKEVLKNEVLNFNTNFSFTIDKNTVPNTFDYSNLFWLKEKPTVGMYSVSNKSIRILPQEELQYPIIFKLEIEGEKIEFIKNLVYKKNLPENGETYIPFTILPEVTTEALNKVTIFNSSKPKEFKVKIKAHKDNVSGFVKLQANENWTISPKQIPFIIDTKNEEQTVVFNITPSENEITSTLNIIANSNGNEFTKELVQIDYAHIPKQTILENSQAKIVRLNIQTKGKNIGYLMGAGDEVAKNLENLDFNITNLTSNDLTFENLQKFDAVILGIRAFNVVEELKYKNKILFDYVQNGGNLIVQYNTTNNLVTNEIAPYNLKISRDRVTNENAPVTFLNKNHNVLNEPNRISAEDFKNWIQEQGLYYPSEWSNEFIPILASHDDGESTKKGALLIAKYGKGNYIYTGLSFFRELPEGVSGAYRLLANIIALE